MDSDDVVVILMIALIAGAIIGAAFYATAFYQSRTVKIAEGLLALLILLRADAERYAKQALSGKYGPRKYKMFREAAEAFKAIIKDGNNAKFNLDAALDFIEFEIQQRERAGVS